VAADDFCYLTTTGRTTGRPHRVEIWYALDDRGGGEGSTLFLLAGGGRSSDWVRNLLVDPVVLVEVDGETRPAKARVLEQGDEAERARTQVYEKYAPRYDGDLTDWRGRSLPVAIDLAPPA
jgi:deazaflavin-dependent oxidoreductase (nitroreductase family)